MKKRFTVILVVLSMIASVSMATADEYLNENQVVKLIEERFSYTPSVQLVSIEDQMRFKIRIPFRPWAELTIPATRSESEFFVSIDWIELNEFYIKMYPWEAKDEVKYYNFEEMLDLLCQYDESLYNYDWGLKVLKDEKEIRLYWNKTGKDEDWFYHVEKDYWVNEEGRAMIPQYAITSLYLAVK